MNELLINQSLVFAHNGEALINSMQLAELFEKRHDNVLRDIRDLPQIEGIEDWFTPTTYIAEGGRPYPAYNMTRKGFSILGMGFTGPKAMAFKVAIIEAFDAMEAELRADHRRVPVRQAPRTPVAGKAKISGALLRETRLLVEMVTNRMQVSAASQQTFLASLLQQVGVDLPEPVVPKSYSSTELARSLGLAPTTFGRRVKDLKIEGLYGEWRMTTTSNGKQVNVFYWNEAGRQAVMAFMSGSAPSNLLDADSEDC